MLLRTGRCPHGHLPWNATALGLPPKGGSPRGFQPRELYRGVRPLGRGGRAPYRERASCPRYYEGLLRSPEYLRVYTRHAKDDVRPQP